MFLLTFTTHYDKPNIVKKEFTRFLKDAQEIKRQYERVSKMATCTIEPVSLAELPKPH